MHTKRYPYNIKIKSQQNFCSFKIAGNSETLEVETEHRYIWPELIPARYVQLFFLANQKKLYVSSRSLLIVSCSSAHLDFALIMEQCITYTTLWIHYNNTILLLHWDCPENSWPISQDGPRFLNHNNYVLSHNIYSIWHYQLNSPPWSPQNIATSIHHHYKTSTYHYHHERPHGTTL